MIISFDDLEFMPEHQENHFDYCRIETSDDQTTKHITEVTWYPNPFDFKRCMTVKYRVFYKRVESEDFTITESINGMIGQWVNGEPYYNENDGITDYSKEFYAVFVDFEDLESAYNYAIK